MRVKYGSDRAAITLAVLVAGCTPLKVDVSPDASLGGEDAASHEGGADGPGDAGGDQTVADASDAGDASDSGGKTDGAFSLSIAHPRNNIVRGSAVTIPITVARSGGFDGAVDIIVPPLPAGISADPLSFPAGVTSASLVLHAKSDAQLGPRVALSAKGVAGALNATAPFDLFVQDASGTHDSTFGTNGIAIVPIGASMDRIGGNGIALQADGKIVLCGLATRPNVGFRSEAFALARLAPDGSLDATFGFQGTVLTNAPQNGLCGAVQIQPDRRIVIAGFLTATGHEFIAARFTEDGAIDPGFGAGSGQFASFLGYSDAKAFALALQPDGHMVVGGFAGAGSAMLRLDPLGALDTFGTNGSGELLDITPSGVISGMALYPDGRIAASISRGPGFRVVRVSASGVLDTSYGTNGIATAPSGAQLDDASGQLALQSDGKVVVVGGLSTDGGPPSAIQLARFTVDGNLDSTFGTGGIVTTTAAGGDASGTAIALLPDGGFAVAAVLPVAGAPSFGVARYTSAGSIDTTFGTMGFAAPAVGPSSVAQALTVDSEGRILVAGIFSAGSRNSAAVVRLWP